MPARHAFDYAIVRVVPRVDREEFLNVGVILYCRELRFLDARLKMDPARLARVAPELDLASIQAQFDVITRVCAGGAAAGPLAPQDQAERFRWLTSPRSTTIQTSAIHCGLCVEPAAALNELAAKTTE